MATGIPSDWVYDPLYDRYWTGSRWVIRAMVQDNTWANTTTIPGYTVTTETIKEPSPYEKMAIEIASRAKVETI